MNPGRVVRAVWGALAALASGLIERCVGPTRYDVDVLLYGRWEPVARGLTFTEARGARSMLVSEYGLVAHVRAVR